MEVPDMFVCTPTAIDRPTLY